MHTHRNRNQTEKTPIEMFIGDFESEIDVFLQAFQNCEADGRLGALSDFSLRLSLDRMDISALTRTFLEALHVTRLSRPVAQGLLARAVFEKQPPAQRFSQVNTLLLQISAEISKAIDEKTETHFQRQNIEENIKAALTPVQWELSL